MKKQKHKTLFGFAVDGNWYMLTLMQSDRELLRQYVEDKSEAAFAELVGRYVRLVYSVALRQVSSAPDLAEDVTQNVFIALARKAPRLTHYDSLVGWLHTTTRNIALSAMRERRRRQAREQEAFAMETHSTPPVPWEQVRPLLDEAVGQLNEQDRQAMLLRYFQGWSHREVGDALGLKEDAARVRVDRAVEKLRRYFAGRGIVTTGALLGEIILTNAAEAEPAGLAGRVNEKTAFVAKAATVGLGGLMLRLIFMTTKNKVLIATTLILVALLFTLGAPKWVGLSAPENKVVSGSSKISSPMDKNGQSMVEPPQTAPVSVSSSNAVGTSLSSATSSQPLLAVNPPPPSPPSAPALGGQNAARVGAAGFNYLQNPYGNFFQKLKLTEAQQDEFKKILADNHEQKAAVNIAAIKGLSAQQNSALENNAINQLELNDDPGLHSADPWEFTQVINDKRNELLGIAAKLKIIDNETDAKLRQLLGSEGFEYYQNYTNQRGVRQWVTIAYGKALQSAGVPELNADQQEALVGIVAQSLQPSDSFIRQKLSHLQQVVDQASAILTPEQTEVLETNPQLNGGPGLSYVLLHQVH